MDKEDRKEDRKYVIFISSTIKDLAAERRALIDATLERGHIPVAMEVFNPYDGDTNVDIINRYIEEADLFVIIVGAIYGSTLPEGPWDLPGFKPTSYTLYEYNQALNKGIPILKFFMDEEVVEGWLDKNGDQEDKDFKKYYTRYRDFIRENKKGQIPQYYRTFETVGDLGRQYILALDNLIARRPDSLVGWVRASKSPLIGDIVAELNRNTKLNERANESPILKEAIANFFLEQYLPMMVRHGYRRFFFESGTSVAHVAKAFIERLEYDSKRKDYAKNHHEFEIETNNILAWMNFVLNLRVKNTALFPSGKLEEEYGATFGNLVDLEMPAGKYSKFYEMCNDIWKEEANKIIESIDAITKKFDEDYGKKGMVFMAASGVDTKTPGFEGPHVKSSCNMLFKRAILRSTCATVMFLDEKKLLSKPFEKDKCFSVCDRNLEWMHICKGTFEVERKKPFAIAIGINEKNMRKTRKILTENLKFDEDNILEGIYKVDNIRTLIAPNDEFSKLWK